MRTKKTRAPGRATKRAGASDPTPLDAWESLIASVELAESTVRELAGSVLEGCDARRALEMLCDARSIILISRPRACRCELPKGGAR